VLLGVATVRDLHVLARTKYTAPLTTCGSGHADRRCWLVGWDGMQANTGGHEMSSSKNKTAALHTKADRRCGSESSLAGGKQRLVVVSNRTPLSFASENGRLTPKHSSGGLVSALEPLLRKHGSLWIGSAGAQD